MTATHTFVVTRSTSLRAALLLVAVAATADTQPVARIEEVGERAACGDCRIELVPSARIVDAADALIGGDPIVVRWGRDTYAVAGPGVSGVLLFRANGRFLRRLGRDGAGPGEYRRVSGLHVDAGDTLWIFDPTNKRVTKVAPGGRVLAHHSIQGRAHPAGIARLQDGSFLLAMDLRTPDAFGMPIHHVTDDFSITRSFGAPIVTVRRADAVHTTRLLSRATPSAAWAAWMTRYRLELWNADGKAQRTLGRGRSWLTEWQDARPSDQPPNPFIVAVQAWADSLLWVIGTVPSKKWKPPKRTPIDDMVRLDDTASLDENFDSIVDLIDLRSGRLLASRRFDESLRGFAGHGEVVQHAVDSDGVLSIKTWRVTLRTPSTGG